MAKEGSGCFTKIFAAGLCVVAVGMCGCASAADDLSRQMAADSAAREEHQRQREEGDRAAFAEMKEANEANKRTFKASVDEGRSRFDHHEAIQNWKRDHLKLCVAQLNDSVCSSAPDGVSEKQRSDCKVECHDAAGRAVMAKLEAALNQCAESDGPPACPLGEVPSSADPDGSGVEAFASIWEKVSSGCAEACAKRRAENIAEAPIRKQAADQGERLSLAYKRCMVATDSTIEAIKYRRYDRELYTELMAKADERCRAANRCDWLEKYSQEFKCSYYAG